MATAAGSIVILDSITHMTEAQRGAVVLAMSHGGRYAAYDAAVRGVAAVILNDAGIGRERAGLAGGPYLARLGVPAATVSNQSARIGDGQDGYANGILSDVNEPAQRLGLKVGMTARAACDVLASTGLPPAPNPPHEDESRIEIVEAGRNGVRVFVLDSMSLVTPADVGHVIVSASHGGILGGKPQSAVKYDATAVVVNDAGFGKDNAGVSRLPALDGRGIAGACVSSFSARIGDGRSTWEDGYISIVNETAAKRGGLVGQSCKEFVAAMVATAR
jgi:hypothetical protein